MKSITFRTDEKLHMDFKIKCVTSSLDMKDFFILCMQKAISDHTFFEQIKNLATSNDIIAGETK